MATWQLPADLHDDPWIAQEIRKAVEPWAHLLRPEEIAHIEEVMLESFVNDPHASKVLRRAHPKVSEQSGQVSKRQADGEEQQGRRRAKG
jgi:hypothetical protein